MTISLPPLPRKICDHTTGHFAVWTEEQMQSYARQAQRMALEEAAKLVEKGIATGTPELWAMPKAIRRLANELDPKP